MQFIKEFTSACMFEQTGYLLLDLNAAIWTGDTDHHLKSLSGVIYKLLLQSSFLGPGGPGESLKGIKQAIKTHRQSNDSPTYGLPHLLYRQSFATRLKPTESQFLSNTTNMSPPRSPHLIHLHLQEHECFCELTSTLQNSCYPPFLRREASSWTSVKSPKPSL